MASGSSTHHDPNLRAQGVVAATEKSFDAQVLFDPFQEQLHNMPSPAKKPFCHRPCVTCPTMNFPCSQFQFQVHAGRILS